MSNVRLKFGERGVLATKLVVGGALLALMLYTIYLWLGWSSIGDATYFIASMTTAVIGYTLFTEWGIVLLVLGLVLFSTMMGGVFIAQEEDE